MPEGPSMVILKEQVQIFNGMRIISVSGNSRIEQHRLLNQKVLEFRTWGKHFLICFKNFTLRVHFLMWGTYLINNDKERPVRLNLTFENGWINFYSCSVKLIEGDLDTLYDFSSDVMSKTWDPEMAGKKLKNSSSRLVCDVLLDQNIFSGVGNIIKNEVLYRIRIHPESITGMIPGRKLGKLIAQTRQYSYDFYNWKKNYELKKHWLVHTRKVCTRCNLPIIRKQTGKGNRRSFFCTNCQKLYA